MNDRPPSLFAPSPECRAAGTVTPAAERRERRSARIFIALLLLLILFAGLALGPTVALVVLLAGTGAAYWRLAKPLAALRRRRELWREPFPPEDRAFLESAAAPYRRLDEEGRELFEQRAKVFLAETAFNGAGMEVDRNLRLLATAAAVTPTLGFPEWEWSNLEEIVFRPEGLDEGAVVDDDGVVTEFEESGMVGVDGVFSGVMMLAADDLAWEFAHPEEGANVGFHEFAHLMALDGGLALAKRDRPGWERLLERERKAIHKDQSLLDDYALVDESEMFAVASELFFTIPRLFRDWHPDLYAVLTRSYQQDPAHWLEQPPRPTPHRRKKRKKF